MGGKAGMAGWSFKRLLVLCNRDLSNSLVAAFAQLGIQLNANRHSTYSTANYKYL